MDTTVFNERPYPPGIAWDEAWRWRQRANEAEARHAALIEAVEKACIHYEVDSSVHPESPFGKSMTKLRKALEVSDE